MGSPTIGLAVGAAVATGVVALAVSDRAAPWALLVILEVLVLGLVAAAVGIVEDRTGRITTVVALVAGATVALVVGPELPVVAVAAAAAMAWPASLLVALVGQAGDETPVDVAGLRRPLLAGAALVVVLVSISVPGVRAAAVAFAVGLPLALLILQLADAGPARPTIRRWVLAAAVLAGVAATVLAAVVLGDPRDGAGPLVVLAVVLAAATALEVVTDRRLAAFPARAAVLLLAAAAIGAAPGGLVLVGVVLLAGATWARTRYPQPAPIPQLLIDLTDAPPRATGDHDDPPSDPDCERNAPS